MENKIKLKKEFKEKKEKKIKFKAVFEEKEEGIEQLYNYLFIK
jgi:hypothetical protein